MNGKKTYTLMLVMAALTVAGYIKGDIELESALAMLGAWGGFSTLRHGMAKNGGTK